MLKTKNPKSPTTKNKMVTAKPPKSAPTAQEAALAELDRAVDPIIRAWRLATREQAQAKADKLEADYNRALDAATAKYERWAKAHGVEP
ncbi:MAG: hypothetical protein L3K23_06550 [Thermoplasmata archaeon]|nr:hypothetical protein [Thermoplasmata archaeon]